MRHSEALTRVEDALTRLGLKDCFGEPLIGLEAVGIVAVRVGQEWDDTVDQFERGEITPDTYVERVLKLLEQFKKDRLRRRLDNRLANLAKDQRETA